MIDICQYLVRIPSFVLHHTKMQTYPPPIHRYICHSTSTTSTTVRTSLRASVHHHHHHPPRTLLQPPHHLLLRIYSPHLDWRHSASEYQARGDKEKNDGPTNPPLQQLVTMPTTLRLLTCLYQSMMHSHSQRPSLVFIPLTMQTSFPKLEKQILTVPSARLPVATLACQASHWCVWWSAPGAAHVEKH